MACLCPLRANIPTLRPGQSRHHRANIRSIALAVAVHVAVGPTTNQPSSTYADAGLPGYWNAFPAYHNTTTYNLVQLDGTVTSVYSWQYGGTQLLNSDDPGAPGLEQETPWARAG